MMPRGALYGRLSRVPLRRRGFAIAVVVLPTILLYFNRIDLTYTPRQALYGAQIADIPFALFDSLPILGAPWAFPTGGLRSGLSCVLQLAIIAALAPSISTLWIFSVAVATARLPVSIYFTRDVGWVNPWLFSHNSLYETSSGWGPSLLALSALEPSLELPRYGIPAMAAILCWLEGRPWTYGISLGFVSILALTQHRDSSGPGSRLVSELGERLRPKLSDEGPVTQLPHGKSNEAPQAAARVGRLQSVAVSFLVLVPYAIWNSAERLPFPSTVPSDVSASLLDILIMSYPRPIDKTLNRDIIAGTIDTYVPHLSRNVTLSAFTHSTNHPVFEALREEYTSASPHVQFHVDRDTHPGESDGLYLHLSEAFRWVQEREHVPEWIMLAEDDFPVCPGGWEVIETVMNKLEADRARGVIKSAFVGTGGSGLILHKSFLGLLRLLLGQYAADDSHSILPPGLERPPADLVVQNCLSGTPGSLCDRPEDKMLIVSQIVLDHTGGRASTIGTTPKNSHLWRCGWRHAFHGAPDVEVVVV